MNLLSLQCSKQVTWCFTPSQPVQLYSGKDYSATLKVFLKAVSGYKQNTFFFSHLLMIFWSAEKWCKDTFPPILHHLSPVILANTAVLASVLFHNSRFNFHCYTLHQAMPTQKSTQKWQVQSFATSCTKDYKGRYSLLQTSFAELPNREVS